MNKKIVFITGGARSGKSRFVLKEASKIPGKKAFIATAAAIDDEMKQRIEEHRQERGDKWDTYEEPLKIAELIKELEANYSVIIIDCLTLWLSNLMHSGLNIESEIKDLISSLVTRYGSTETSASGSTELAEVSLLVYIVSNEVGMGIVPDNELARRFRDMSGILNQKVSEIADEVNLVTAGIPIKIK